MAEKVLNAQAVVAMANAPKRAKAVVQEDVDHVSMIVVVVAAINKILVAKTRKACAHTTLI